MRITNAMLLRNALADVNQQRLRLADIQEKASSGLAINRPSDDPVGASAALLLRAALDATEQFDQNVTQARNRVGILEGAMGASMDVLIEARGVAVEGANGTLDATTRLILAEKVAALHERLLSEVNTRSSETYVFGGFSTDTVPFVASGPFTPGLPAPSVSFVGDANEIQTPIDEGVSATTTLNGGRIFSGDSDGDGSVDTGAEDLFDVLATLRDALVANDGSAVAATLSRFDQAIDQISLERTRVGMTDTKIADWQARLAERKVDLEIRLTQTQDADLATVFSDLVNQENALRLALESTTRIMQPSLLDFLG